MSSFMQDSPSFIENVPGVRHLLQLSVLEMQSRILFPEGIAETRSVNSSQSTSRKVIQIQKIHSKNKTGLVCEVSNPGINQGKSTDE